MKVYKIYDSLCPVCERMSQFDSDVALGLGTGYKTRELEAILDPDNFSEEDATLAHYVEVYAVNPDYTLDLPVYVVLRGKTYAGHVTGDLDRREFETKLEKIVNGQENSKSKDHLFG